MIGAIIGAGVSVVSQGLSVGYENINWGKVGIDTLIGGATGFVSGAIFGAIGGAVKVANAAKAWSPSSTQSGFKQMVSHYNNHVIGEGQRHMAKTIVQYTNQAKQFFVANGASGYRIGVDAIKIAGAPGGIWTNNGLIKSFWYILKL